MRLLTLFVAVSVAVIGVFLGFWMQTRISIPTHLLNHVVVNVPNLLTKEEGAELMRLSKEMAEFPTNTADLKFYKTEHEHIGEAIKIGANGKCDHPFLVPSQDKTLCVLPGRIDVGRHFILSGGVEGLKEPYELAVSRLQSFGRYMFDVSAYPAVEALFASESFLSAARAVCPSDQQYLEPFQFNFITQVPGQTVATHSDAPYFWGADRFRMPQWLLVVMVFSGLFRERFVHQVQVVGYYHNWTDTARRGGEFVYWDTAEPEPKRLPATTLGGNAVDGSKTVHAATVYFPERKAPKLDKSADSMLKYTGAGEAWQVLSNGKLVANYTTDDLRMTIVYRARCFRSAADAEKFKNQPESDQLSVESILETLQGDLTKRGRLNAADAKNMTRLDLALLLMNEYVHYPLPSRLQSLIPYNYCALTHPQLFPALAPIVRLIC